ncbi:MAG: threonylcarbamoyl-AMP synthase [Rhodothermales bacterium]|nr:threonylcarbamoyl-AMP synthase [Rhodothermales bacterium]
METLVTDSPAHAATFVADGRLVAFPTETVYGVGAPAFNPHLIRRIFDVKGRPSDNPLIVHIGRKADFGLIGSIPNDYTKALVDAFFPGPLTVVVPRTGAVPDVVTAGLDTVAIRMPDHPVGRAFLLACDTPMAAPSANLSGRPSPTTWSAVLQDLGGRIPCILNGGRSKVGLESTVVDCTGDSPVILRSGAYSLRELQKVVPTCTQVSQDELTSLKSPGVHHKHYAPNATVVVVNGEWPPAFERKSGYIGLEQLPPDKECDLVHVCADVEEYGRLLFSFFRECEDRGLPTIYCLKPSLDGLGMAIADRLTRAAAATADISSAAR